MASPIEAGDRVPGGLVFDRSVLPLLTFVVGGIALAVGVFMTTDWLIASGVVSRTPAIRLVFAVGGFAPLAILAWLLLRWEGVTPSAIGFRQRHVLPAVGLVTAIWVGAHLFTVLRIVAGGGDIAIGIPPTTTTADWVTSLLAQILIVGIIEEFAFRGYFQNKLVALFGGGQDRSRKAGAILVATSVFALWHIPQRVLVAGVAMGDLVPTVLSLLVYGLFFGVMYELTRNVLFTGVLHGTFNAQPILLSSPQGDPNLVVTLFVLPLAAMAVWGYRRWATRTQPADFRPQLLQ